MRVLRKRKLKKKRRRINKMSRKCNSLVSLTKQMKMKNIWQTKLLLPVLLQLI